MLDTLSPRRRVDGEGGRSGNKKRPSGDASRSQVVMDWWKFMSMGLGRRHRECYNWLYQPGAPPYPRHKVYPQDIR